MKIKVRGLIISLVNRKDLYSLIEAINKADLYKSNANDNMPNIGPVSTLEYMIESTFGFDRSLQMSMTEHLISLENHIFRWRAINGDGNCYYRAIMFAFIENLVLEKNILMLKNIVVEMNSKFRSDYPNIAELPLELKKEILDSFDKSLVIKIFYLILENLENSNHVSAYEILLKSFNFCKHFDIAMVMYFRLKIFEFIKENHNKVYTKDFSVKIGNLLPSNYETEGGGI